jgi:hypothetical protein
VRVDPSGHADCKDGDDACWQNEWWWKNRWYEAHGQFWNAQGGGWTTQSTPRFSDLQILIDTFFEGFEQQFNGLTPFGKLDYEMVLWSDPPPPIPLPPIRLPGVIPESTKQPWFRSRDKDKRRDPVPREPVVVQRQDALGTTWSRPLRGETDEAPVYAIQVIRALLELRSVMRIVTPNQGRLYSEMANQAAITWVIRTAAAGGITGRHTHSDYFEPWSFQWRFDIEVYYGHQIVQQ